jgi:hypothetical protein
MCKLFSNLADFTSDVKKKWVLLTLAGLVIVSCVLALATWEYFGAGTGCTGNRTPRTPEGERIFVGIRVYEVKPYTVITSEGRWYPGDYNDQAGEGIWHGNITLLFAGKNGATFVVFYPVNDRVAGFSESSCLWYVPVGDYRD